MKSIRLAGLWIIGAFAGFFIALWEVFTHFLPTMLQVCGYSLVFWIAFNFSVGTAIAFQIDFVQSFSFVCLIKVIKGAIAP